MIVFIFLVVGTLLYACFKIVCLQRHREMYVCELNRSYETALAFLKEDPSNSAIRARCERLGREFYSEMLPGIYGKQAESLCLDRERTREYKHLGDELLARDLRSAEGEVQSTVFTPTFRKAS